MAFPAEAVWTRSGIHHTDRGCQYCSHDYQKLLRKHGFSVSMSGTGNCYDNAALSVGLEKPLGLRGTGCIDESLERSKSGTCPM